MSQVAIWRIRNYVIGAKSVRFHIPIGKSANHLAALGASARSYDLFNCR